MSFRATLPVPPQRTPLTVTGLSILSTVPILVGQLTGTGLDPLLAPISQYVHLPGGYALVLAGAALLAGCGLVLAHHLVQGAATDRGAARRVAVGLLVSYGVAMILVGAVYPAIVLWVLRKPGVRAAFRSARKPGEGAQP